jgi:hypothetical protein
MASPDVRVLDAYGWGLRFQRSILKRIGQADTVRAGLQIPRR